MTPRSWLLLFLSACAGILAALAWPEADRNTRLFIPDVVLGHSDIDTFVRTCKVLGEDRDAVRIELPHGMGMLEFATQMSRGSHRLEASCKRAEVAVVDFLAIVTAVGKAARLDARRQEWDKQLEGRLADEDLAAEVYDKHGLDPLPLSDPEAEPPWWAGVPDPLRKSHATFVERGEDALAAWETLMRPPEPPE